MRYVHLLFYVLVLVLNSEAGITFDSNTGYRVNSVSDLTCSSQMHHIGSDTSYHQWNHVYTQTWAGFDGIITNYTSVKAINSKYTLTLEKFDNLSAIYSHFYTLDASNRIVKSMELQCPGNQIKNVINLADDGYYHYTVDYVFPYTEKVFKFNCQKYSAISKYVYVAWINTEGNRIIVFKNSPVVSDFTLLKVHNGSILCCVYYVETTTANSVEIRRFVKDKTLFVYQESVSGNDLATNTGDNSTTKNYCDRVTNISVATGITNNIVDKNPVVATIEIKQTEISNKQPSNTDNTIKFKLNKDTDDPSTVDKGNDNANHYEKGKLDNLKPNENLCLVINTDRSLDFSTQRTDTAIQNAANMAKESRVDETDSENKIPGDSKPNDDHTLTNWRIGTPNKNARDASSLTNVQKHILESITSKTRRNASEVAEDFSTAKDLIENSNIDKQDGNSNLMLIVISTCATLPIFIVIFIVFRQYCRNKRPAIRPQQPLPKEERETPFYLNLLFQKECQREMQAAENVDDVYEEILDH